MLKAAVAVGVLLMSAGGAWAWVSPPYESYAARFTSLATGSGTAVVRLDSTVVGVHNPGRAEVHYQVQVITTSGGVGLTGRVIAGGMVAALSCEQILGLVRVPSDVPYDQEGFVRLWCPRFSRSPELDVDAQFGSRDHVGKGSYSVNIVPGKLIQQ
jgi:hypothetical protein